MIWCDQNLLLKERKVLKEKGIIVERRTRKVLPTHQVLHWTEGLMVI
jgi:hypothetical protein